MPIRTTLQHIAASFLHLFYPHTCAGCGTDTLPDDGVVCAHCFSQLPVTGFLPHAGNPVEKLFYGRVPITAAGSLYYFTRHSLLQRIIFQLKYRNHPPTGLWLGRLLGQQLKESKRFDHVTAILPVPLHPRKARQRGYNQSLVIAQGIAEVCGWEIPEHALLRTVFTATQTHRNRESRMQNLQQAFTADCNALGQHRHVLLIDDVITTGATLEACALALQQAGNISVSIATVGYTPPR